MLIGEPKILELPSLYPGYMLDVNNGIVYGRRGNPLKIRDKDGTVNLINSRKESKSLTVKMVVFISQYPDYTGMLNSRALTLEDSNLPYASRLKLNFNDNIKRYYHPKYTEYWADIDGNIYNDYYGKLSQELNSGGYLRFEMRAGGLRTEFRSHRFVFECFYSRPIGRGLVINHKDGVKTNNSKPNLEECTIEQNNLHAKYTGLVLCNDKHPNSKLTNEVVIKIREYLNNGVSFKHIKSEFKELNLTTNMLSKIKNNRTWRNLL